MSEKVNMREQCNKNTWLSHLILQNISEDKIEALQKQKGENYDFSNMEIGLTIDNVAITTLEFETLVEGWAERMMQSKLQSVHFDDFNAAVKKATEKLIQEKVSPIFDAITDLNDHAEQITSNLWEDSIHTDTINDLIDTLHSLDDDDKKTKALDKLNSKGYDTNPNRKKRHHNIK